MTIEMTTEATYANNFRLSDPGTWCVSSLSRNRPPPGGGGQPQHAPSSTVYSQAQADGMCRRAAGSTRLNYSVTLAAEGGSLPTQLRTQLHTDVRGALVVHLITCACLSETHSTRLWSFPSELVA